MIGYHLSSKLISETHPLREMIEGRRSEATYGDEEEITEKSAPVKSEAEAIKEAAAAAPSAEDTIPAGGGA